MHSKVFQGGAKLVVGKVVVEVDGSAYGRRVFPGKGFLQSHLTYHFHKAHQGGRSVENIHRETPNNSLCVFKCFQKRFPCIGSCGILADILRHMEILELYLRILLLKILHKLKGDALLPLGAAIDNDELFHYSKGLTDKTVA